MTLSTLNANLKAQQAALKDSSGLSTTERLIALGQLNGLQAQLLDDHRPAHDEPAAARARQGRRGAGDHDPGRGDEDHRAQPRNTVLVAGLIGLILGIVAALLYEPAARAVRSRS